MISASGGPQRTLAVLEASGVSSSRTSWERLLALNYATLVEPGSNIIDIGGKKGRHVAYFLDVLRARRVCVFEPNPAMADILRRRFAGYSNVTVIETALSDHAGAEEFIVNLGAPGESGLRQRAYSNPDRARLQRIAVPVGRLDDQIFEHPVHYVKIDIEGGEIGVLRGGRDFLARHRPLLSVEYGRPSYSVYGHTADTLYEEAAALGYAVCDLFRQCLRVIGRVAGVRRPAVLGLSDDSGRTAAGHRGGARHDRSPRHGRVAPTGATSMAGPPPALFVAADRAAAQASWVISQRSHGEGAE